MTSFIRMSKTRKNTRSQRHSIKMKGGDGMSLSDVYYIEQFLSVLIKNAYFHLNKHKIVGTLDSGSEAMDDIIHRWKALSTSLNEDALKIVDRELNYIFTLRSLIHKNEINEVLLDFKIGTYDLPKGKSGNSIFFYSDKYLKILSEVSDKSKEELLDLVGPPQNDDFLMDLIFILFGDYVESPHVLKTDEGKHILKLYKEKVENIPQSDKKECRLFMKSRFS